ncbi:response regulator transcription factor [Kineococcus sp. SYSU DK001]|uniref:response regulator transcription factor n=1 Tax=Kineococcus sp. SYSU DK001 TaxID=3383122 RepID=UPI003D7D322B
MRVLVVHEQEVVQLGLRALFTSTAWVAGCAVTARPEVALQITARQQPQLVLVDHRVDHFNGLQLVRRLKEVAPYSRVVLLTSVSGIDGRVAASSGASAVLRAGDPLAHILDTCTRLVSGRPTRVLVPTPRAGLSVREAEVLEKLAQGLSNPEIAGALHLSRHTVKQHTSTLYRKLGVRNRAEAASYALQRGLVA